MRLLADENFPKPFVDVLRNGGHDVIWARTDCVGWPDTALLDFAESESRILLTLDKDFWQIALQRRSPLENAGVVLFRAHPATTPHLPPLIRTFLSHALHWPGHISVIAHDGIRIMPARRS